MSIAIKVAGEKKKNTNFIKNALIKSKEEENKKKKKKNNTKQ